MSHVASSNAFTPGTAPSSSSRRQRVKQKLANNALLHPHTTLRQPDEWRRSFPADEDGILHDPECILHATSYFQLLIDPLKLFCVADVQFRAATPVDLQRRREQRQAAGDDASSSSSSASSGDNDLENARADLFGDSLRPLPGLPPGVTTGALPVSVTGGRARTTTHLGASHHRGTLDVPTAGSSSSRRRTSADFSAGGAPASLAPPAISARRTSADFEESSRSSLLGAGVPTAPALRVAAADSVYDPFAFKPTPRSPRAPFILPTHAATTTSRSAPYITAGASTTPSSQPQSKHTPKRRNANTKPNNGVAYLDSAASSASADDTANEDASQTHPAPTFTYQPSRLQEPRGARKAEFEDALNEGVYGLKRNFQKFKLDMRFAVFRAKRRTGLT